jgi:hypothetical protein
LQFVPFIKYNYVDQIKTDEMGGASNMQRRHEKFEENVEDVEDAAGRL